MLKTLVSLGLLINLVAGAGFSEAAPVLPVSVLETRPHSPDCYTQGLFFHGGSLYESCGLYGRSSFNRWPFPEPAVKPLKALAWPEKYFAEGAEEAEGEIYVLTWREHTGFVLAPGSLMFLRQFSYPGEGWGLAWDGRRLWRSDGSARLYPHRLGDFAPAGEPLVVRDAERDLEVGRLNELEWDAARGLILANIYGQELVAAIDPGNGQVRFWLDAGPLLALAREAGLPEGADPMETVLNGLALADDGLWLTGKLWPAMYKIAWPPAGFEKIDEEARK